MAQLQFNGPWHLRVASFLTLNRIALSTRLRHLMGKRIAPDWDWLTETGIRFWRHQFAKAMAQTDMAHGRAIFESVVTMTDDIYDVDVQRTPHGLWITPTTCATDVTLLYLHGGGYTFNGPVSDRYACMLAHRTGARLYMPFYRLTPEFSHPAQAEDALAAWDRLAQTVPADRVTIIGDSAGGHMVLTLLQHLRRNGLDQPALCIALCPWTDIGARGASLTENDKYDLVQGWMALRFGDWLDPQNTYGRERLSPISQNYQGLAPIYMQAGGREVLRDMIIDFAQLQASHGADIMLDIWDDMPHNFQAYDSDKPSSIEALERIRSAVVDHAGHGQVLSRREGRTSHASGCFRSDG